MYDHFLNPGKVGPLTLRNRLIMPGMSDHFSNKTGDFVDVCKAYYSERARGGTGLIITSFCCIDPSGQAEPCQLRCYDEAHLSGLKRITDGVHYYGGAIFLQLHHAGRATSSELIGMQPMGPSPLPTMLDTGEGILEMETPREMTKEDISFIVGRYINAAVLAKRAGFDGVELHAAHGYLLCQFLSEASNKRTDEYGGGIENRARIVREIVAGIRAGCGPAFPISVRISGRDGAGLNAGTAVEIARELEKIGVDLINVSGGGDMDDRSIISPAGTEQGFLVPIAAAIKEAVSTPVAVVGMIRDFDFADRAIAEGRTDFVCMGRPHIADPYIIKKLSSGREREIRRCLTCMNCLDSQARLGCSVNPVVGNESDFKAFSKNGNGRRVAVVGGGPSGCEAARVLALRGFDVTLFEHQNRLGGQVNLAAVPKNKFRLKNLMEYYAYMLPKLGVMLHLGVEADADTLAGLSPHAIFLASGSVPVKPPVPGIDGPNVYTAERVMAGEVTLEGKRIVMVGSGNTGIETAEELLERGNSICIADMLPSIGQLAGVADRYVLMDLIAAGVERLPNCRLASVGDGVVTFQNTVTGEELTREFDALVYALGVRRDLARLDEFEAICGHVLPVGDARTVGDISTSVKSGFYTAFFFDEDREDII